MRFFLTVDGGDGAGKSSIIPPLREVLKAAGHTVVVTREPGGTMIGEKLRELVLHQDMDPKTETLLMFAARRDHVQKVIRPALDAGFVVICDRFTDSSFAYQGGGKGVSWDTLSELESFVQTDDGHQLQPDLTLWLDIDPATAQKRRAKVRNADRFEKENLEFFDRVRASYAARYKASNGRIVRIDAGQSIDCVWKDVLLEVERMGLINRAQACRLALDWDGLGSIRPAHVG